MDAIRETAGCSVCLATASILETCAHEVASSGVDSCESRVEDLLTVRCPDEFKIEVLNWVDVEIMHR